MINIEDIKNNVDSLKQSLPRLNIDSIFLEQNGKIDEVFYNNECLHELRSCSKLLVAMAIGIAIDKGMFSLDTLIYPTIKNVVHIVNKENIEKIKKWDIKTLLAHTTGYEKIIMSAKEIKEKQLDTSNIINYALNVDIPYEVGTRFAYNNVEPFILSVFFQEKFVINLSDFINENIFNKLDIKEYKWDNYGKYCPGCTGLFLKHTDFHKLGKLLLNNGLYNGIQVVSERWIKEMCSMQFKTPEIYKKERVLPKIGIGYFTFISRDGFIFRDGSNGQNIILNKEKNLLITIMATEKDMKNITEVLRNLI
mgnify:FL=1